MSKKTVTVIDVGSNTIRACVYRVRGRESDFKKVVDVSKAVGLAGYVDESGTMSDEGIDAGCRALSKMASVSDLAGSDTVAILATGAVRNCSNTEKVVKALGKKAGHKVRVLSGKEEALLSTAGASWSTGVRTGLFFDLGGGSTELTSIRAGRIVDVDSIPIGALSSWKRESHAILPDAEEVAAIEAGFTMMMQASSVRVANQATVVGVGGSMRLALRVAEGLGREPNGRLMRPSDFDMILDRGVSDPEGFCRLILKLRPGRIHTFLPACAIARAILRSAGCDGIIVSKAGLREGYLLSVL